MTVSLHKLPTDVIESALETGLMLGRDFASGFEKYVYSEYEGEWVNRENLTVAQFVFECFESYNQFSPWEQTASFWNSFEDSEAIWNAFEWGLATGAVGVSSDD